MERQTRQLVEHAIQLCTDEDEVYAQTYIPAQSTRLALRTAIRALTQVLTIADKKED